jgi:hypothetical protein
MGIDEASDTTPATPDAVDKAAQAALESESESQESPATPAAKELDLGLKDDTKLSSESIASIREFAAQHELSAEAAQAYAQHFEGEAEKLATQGDSDFAAVREIWNAELSKEWPTKEAMTTAQANIRTVITEFGPEGFYNRLRENGYLDEPDFCRTINNIATKMQEKRNVVPAIPLPLKARALTAREKYAKDYPNSPFPGD